MTGLSARSIVPLLSPWVGIVDGVVKFGENATIPFGLIGRICHGHVLCFRSVLRRGLLLA